MTITEDNSKDAVYSRCLMLDNSISSKYCTARSDLEVGKGSERREERGERRQKRMFLK